MEDLQRLLKSAEEAVQAVDDTELRKVAFAEVLRFLLASSAGSAQRPSVSSAATSRRRRSTVPAAARASAVPAVRAEVASLDISPDESGLMAWSTLTADWKKFCWMLEAARRKSVDGLSNSEISFLIEKTFRESYGPDSVNNLKVQIKKGIVKNVLSKSGDREFRVWRILAAGIKEVAVKVTAAAE